MATTGMARLKAEKSIKTTRIKQPAIELNLQDIEETQGAIKELGDLQREFLRITTQMNDKIAIITEEYAPELEAYKKDMDILQKGIQSFCESRRDNLTQNGKVKTVKLTTGEVSWRQRPPSVSLRGMESVLEMLKKLGLDRLIRVKEEVNKDAILNEPETVKGIAGISVRTGVEDFIIKPFENKAQA